MAQIQLQKTQQDTAIAEAAIASREVNYNIAIQESDNRVSEFKEQLKADQLLHKQTVDCLSQRINILQTKLAKNKAYMVNMNTELHNTQLKARDNIAANIAMISKLRESVNTSKQQLQALKQQNTQLAKNLEDCKERVLQMLPHQAMTDDQIGEAYQSLCEAVQTWVVDTFGDIDGTMFTIQAAMNKLGEHNLLLEYIGEKEMQLTLDFPQVDNNLLACFIFRHLYLRYLEPTLVFPGIHAEIEKMLNKLVEGLESANPPKDHESVQMWRVDLQRALGGIEELKSKKSEHMQASLDAMIAHLEKVVKENTSIDFNPGVCHKIIAKSADLAQNIRLSATEYFFISPFDPSAPADYRDLLFEDMERLDIIDSKTGQPLPPSPVVSADDQGRVGKKLCTILPALVRKGAEGKADLELVKATVLVQFDHDVQRVSRKRKAIVQQPGLGGGLGNTISKQPDSH